MIHLLFIIKNNNWLKLNANNQDPNSWTLKSFVFFRKANFQPDILNAELKIFTPTANYLILCVTPQNFSATLYTLWNPLACV